jgi:hypothetical protein
LNKSPQADPITSRVFLVRLFSIKKQFRHDKVEIELGLVNGDKKKLANPLPLIYLCNKHMIYFKRK